jgi:hypothetical protein
MTSSRLSIQTTWLSVITGSWFTPSRSICCRAVHNSFLFVGEGRRTMLLTAPTTSFTYTTIEWAENDVSSLMHPISFWMRLRAHEDDGGNLRSRRLPALSA